MTDLVVVAAVALGVSGLIAAAYVTGTWVKSAQRLEEIERQVAGLRREVIDCRLTQQHDTAVVVRRLETVEASAAQAANEVRMASDQIIARFPSEDRGDRGRKDRRA